jgi:hypothetical protein
MIKNKKIIKEIKIKVDITKNNRQINKYLIVKKEEKIEPLKMINKMEDKNLKH